MSMRNHWVEIECSSLKNDYATGPKGKNDDMTINLYQDNEGSSQHILRIRCYPNECTDTETGKKYTLVVTQVYNQLTGEVIFTHETRR